MKKKKRRRKWKLTHFRLFPFSCPLVLEDTVLLNTLQFLRCAVFSYSQASSVLLLGLIGPWESYECRFILCHFPSKLLTIWMKLGVQTRYSHTILYYQRVCLTLDICLFNCFYPPPSFPRL